MEQISLINSEVLPPPFSNGLFHRNAEEYVSHLITWLSTGFRNTSSQISASYSPDGQYVISASEDSQVYIWRREEPRHVGSGKVKSVTMFSHEHFQCRDVSVAMPWPGSLKSEPPTVEIHSKRHSRRSTPQPHSTGTSPTREDSTLGHSKRSQLPPLPNKKNSILERATSCLVEESEQPSQMDPGIGPSDSFTSATSSIRYDDSPSISASSSSPSQSWSSSWSWFEGGGHGNTIQATAWGLVIVTAGLGGEIRAYQNFGLPFKVSRQTNLFRDLT